jgi:hypothetical protein
MAKTYEPIATTTLSSTTNSVSFSSISGSYTDLVLVINPIKGTMNYPYLRFNGDSASNYSVTSLSGNGTSAVSTRSANISQGYLNESIAPTTTGTTYFIVNIQNYSNSTTYKAYLARGTEAGSGTDAIIGSWRSTAAITSVAVNAGNGGTFEIGSNFTLYGIKAA